MRDKEVTTSKRHFIMFKTYFEEFADLFGLDDWDVDFLHENDEERLHAVSTTTGDIDQHQALIRFSKSWPKSMLSKDNIKRVAMHEALEVVLMELRIIAGERFINANEIDRAVHCVIHRVSNLLLKSFVEEE
jgi:hypothetical protein